LAAPSQPVETRRLAASVSASPYVMRQRMGPDLLCVATIGGLLVGSVALMVWSGRTLLDREDKGQL